MKTIGLIGGITWHSSAVYYQLLNQLSNERLGGAATAPVIMHSINFGQIKLLTEAGNWEGIAALLAAAARGLEQAGADCILIGANTMHKVAASVQQAVTVPVIHIAQVTAAAIAAQKISKVLLLGTRYTMQLNFYSDVLKENGIDTLRPDAADTELLNTAIYNELSVGLLLPETKALFVRAIEAGAAAGAQGVILGCTEIPLLIKQADSPIPVFDTTALHAAAAVAFAAGG